MTIQELLEMIDRRGLPMDAPILFVEGSHFTPVAMLERDDLNNFDDAAEMWPEGPCLVLEAAAD